MKCIRQRSKCKWLKLKVSWSVADQCAQKLLIFRSKDGTNSWLFDLVWHFRGKKTQIGKVFQFCTLKWFAYENHNLNYITCWQGYIGIVIMRIWIINFLAFVIEKKQTKETEEVKEDNKEKKKETKKTKASFLFLNLYYACYRNFPFYHILSVSLCLFS